MPRLYSDRVALTASTNNQTVITKTWNHHVVIRAMKLETSETTAANVVIRGSVGDSEFLYDTYANTLELCAWIPLNVSPPTIQAAFKIEADEAGGGTPDVAVTIMYDIVKAPVNNLPWVHGSTVSAASADSLASKQFDRNAVLTWYYLNITAGTFKIKVGGSPVNGDDLGEGITEPRTTDEGAICGYPIPANVSLVGTTASATGSFVVKVDKPW